MSNLPDIFFGTKISDDISEEHKKEIEEYYKMVGKIINKPIDDILEKLDLTFEEYINKIIEEMEKKNEQ